MDSLVPMSPSYCHAPSCSGSMDHRSGTAHCRSPLILTGARSLRGSPAPGQARSVAALQCRQQCLGLGSGKATRWGQVPAMPHPASWAVLGSSGHAVIVR